MSSIRVSIFLIILTLFSCSSNPMDAVGEEDKLAHQIAGKTAVLLKEKYDLKFIGISLSADKKKFSEMGLLFNLYHILSKEDGRKLIINCAQEYLNEINNFEEIKPYLSQVPFSYSNIELSIYIYSDEKMKSTVDPDICCISLRGGNIYFKTHDPQNPNRYKSVTKESYEEALKIVRGNQ